MQWSHALSAGVTLALLSVLCDQTAKERRDMQSFRSVRASFKSMYVGSRPPTDGRWETWFRAVAESPYPIRYEARPIEELIDPVYFNGSNYYTMMQKKKMLATTLKIWGNCYPECDFPQHTKMPVFAWKYSKIVYGTTKVYCLRHGSTVLSCGVENLNTDVTADSRDNFRYAIARGKIYCVCKDRTSVWRNMPPRIRCVAWCAVNVKGLGIVKTVQRGHNESFTVSCPRGKKVLGCSSRLVMPKKNSATRFYKVGSARDYWQFNESACLCNGTYGYYQHVKDGFFYDSHYREFVSRRWFQNVGSLDVDDSGEERWKYPEPDTEGEHQCIATCAADVPQHTIVKQDGRGTVRVECPDGMAVLGCGAETPSHVNQSSRRSAAVYDYNECKCYDDYDVICYAVCGGFVGGGAAMATCCHLLMFLTILSCLALAF